MTTEREASWRSGDAEDCKSPDAQPNQELICKGDVNGVGTPAPSAKANLPTRFDYSDVVWPDPRHDFMWPGEHMLYVIESLDLIKIGIARDVVARFKGMTCDNPHGIRMLVAYVVPKALARYAEAYCHEKLMPYHHHGEWFRASPQVARKVAYAICFRACASRRWHLERASSLPGRGHVVRKPSPPASIAMLKALRAHDGGPTVPVLVTP